MTALANIELSFGFEPRNTVIGSFFGFHRLPGEALLCIGRWSALLTW